jgi:hypothetical protein
MAYTRSAGSGTNACIEAMRDVRSDESKLKTQQNSKMTEMKIQLAGSAKLKTSF